MFISHNALLSGGDRSLQEVMKVIWKLMSVMYLRHPFSLNNLCSVYISWMKLAEFCIKLTVQVWVKGTQLDLTKRFSNKTIFCKYSNQLHLIFVASNKFPVFFFFFWKKKRKKKKKKTSEKRDITPNISLNLCFLIWFLLHLQHP